MARPTPNADGQQSGHVEFEQMYRANVALVFNYARSRLGPDAAAEVTSDVFVAAVTAFRNGQAASVTTPWLMSVTRNKVVDTWRRAGKRKVKLHLLETPGPIVNLSETVAERAVVVAALDQLPHDQRMLLILHHVDGVPLSEIATDIGKSEQAVQSAMARARRAFRKVYRPDQRFDEATKRVGGRRG